MKTILPHQTKTTHPSTNRILVSQFFTSTILATYFYVFMEWLFFVTKPSFFDTISFGGKLSILFKTGLLLSLFGCLVLFIVIVLSLALSRLVPNKNIQYMAVIVPGGILSALTLVLIDNFTYTVLKRGIITTSGIWRGVYAAFFIAIFLIVCRWFFKNVFVDISGVKIKKKLYTREKKLQKLALILLAISIIAVLFDLPIIEGSDKTLLDSHLEDHPNILLLGGDGINAMNMSAYGYERDTTPNISALAGRSLFMENAFANAGNSAGSVITILTGKNATETRVVYSPDILKGKDAFQHLPGILHQEGYYTAELGFTHYIDAYDLNLQNGFDEVNGKVAQKTIVLRLLEPLGYDVAYFTSQMFDKLKERLFHIFYVKKMENAYNAILEPSIVPDGDRQKIKRLVNLISETNKPLFVHLHLMGTHGSIFFPRSRVFSEGENQTEPWMTDFYDDSILTYDSYVGEVINQLAKTGKLDNTIIVIYTDHNMQWATNQRIPLIIYFPKGEHAGKVQHNAQNIDIAPTLLDYLGLPRPGWMEGASLLSGGPEDDRLIFSTGAAYLKDNAGLLGLDIERIRPPFYQFGYLGIVNCQIWYRYNLVEDIWESGLVHGYTSDCEGDKLLTPEQIKNALINHMKSNGFDTSSLENKIITPAPVPVP